MADSTIVEIAVQNTAEKSQLNSVEVDGYKIEFGGLPILFWDDTEIVIKRYRDKLKVILRPTPP